MGCFYIKPSFPEIRSHVCNCGFMTAPRFRKMGVATLMGRLFIKLLANALGDVITANLVFKSNEATV